MGLPTKYFLKNKLNGKNFNILYVFECIPKNLKAKQSVSSHSVMYDFNVFLFSVFVNKHQFNRFRKGININV